MGAKLPLCRAKRVPTASLRMEITGGGLQGQLVHGFQQRDASWTDVVDPRVGVHTV